MNAAQILPGFTDRNDALMNAGLLNDVGLLQQQQGQNELEGPMNLQERLLGNAQGQMGSFAPLLGQVNVQDTNRNEGLGALGGAMSGASLGAMTKNPWLTGIGAVGGGLLGAFG